jgi:predicted metal-dependent phosphoesterase TrpH
MNGYDLHSHTCHSFDSDTSLEDFIAAGAAAGLTGVAVTDHDTIEGALRLRDKNPPFDVIVGCEVTLFSGAHIIGLFLEKPVQGGWLEETAAAIHAQGGLVLLPHPYRAERGALAETDADDDVSALMAHVDLVEVFNAKSPPLENKRAVALAQAWGKRGTAGSDAHRPARLGQGHIRLSGRQRHLSPRRLLCEPVRIFGVDQMLPDIERIRRRRDSVRRLALRFQKQIPKSVWQWGKRRWDRMCDDRYVAGDQPWREYARFATAKIAAAASESSVTSPAQAAEGGQRQTSPVAGREAYGND